MKTLRKGSIACIFIFSFFITGLFTCCNSKNKNGAINPDDKEIHLRVWESNNGPDKFIKQAAIEYNKLHPNIFVDYINVEIDYATGEMKTDGPNGVGADLFVAPHDKLGELVNEKMVLPTQNQKEIEAKVLGACSKALNYNGTMYGYPMCAETYALFYNKKLIKENEVPATWEDLVKWVQKFNLNHEYEKGFVMDVYNAYYSILFTTSNNNRLFGEYGTDGSHPNMNTPAAVKGMEFFQSLRKKLGLENIELSSPICDGLFISGNAAMHITGLWNVKKFEDAGIDFGVTCLPSLPGENKPAASFSGTRGLFVSSYCKHPKEAGDFAEFLLTPEMQKLRYELNGTMPSVNITVNSKYMSGFLKQLDYAFPMPSIPQMGKFWSEMGSASYYIWQGANVKEQLDNANKNIVN